jgi:hypothetical protein
MFKEAAKPLVCLMCCLCTLLSTQLQANQVTSRYISQQATASQAVMTIAVVVPSNGATVRNNTQTVPLKLAANAQQLPVASWEIRLNDEVHTASDTLPTTLYPVYRGTHTLVVNGYNKTGKLIAVSKPITFYKHQAIQK